MAAHEAVLPEPAQPYIPEDTLASRLVQLRHGLGLTQVEAAEKCGLDDGSWSNWERGGMPRNMLAVVEAIHRGLGVDRDWLAWGQNLKDLMVPDLRLVHAIDLEDTQPGPGQQIIPFPPPLVLIDGGMN